MVWQSKLLGILTVSKVSISKWCGEFSKECQAKAQTNPDAPNEMELMKESLRLRKEPEEARKEKPLCPTRQVIQRVGRNGICQWLWKKRQRQLRRAVRSGR